MIRRLLCWLLGHHNKITVRPSYESLEHHIMEIEIRCLTCDKVTYLIDRQNTYRSTDHGQA